MKLLLRSAFYICALALPWRQAHACSLVKIADLPMTELGTHYAVMANVAGQQRPMIVDTGSPQTLLSAKAADRGNNGESLWT